MTTNAPPFRYGLNTSTLRGHKLPLVEMIDITARAGYTVIEPWIDELEGYVAQGGSLPDLKRRFEDSGLSVEGAIGFFAWIVDDEAARKTALDEARRNMELLAAIGGKRLAAPAVGATEINNINLNAAAERYRALLAVGDEVGVVPQVEVWGFSQTLQRLGEAAYIALESGHPDACILPDIYHLYKGGSGYAGLNLLRPSAFPVLHVNDYPDIAPATITDADRVYAGDGLAPWAEIIATLKRIGYDGVLSLELFNPTYYAQSPLIVAQAGLQKLQAVVEQNW